MKIDFLIGQNRYNSTSHFAKAFARALERKGAQTRLHQVSDGQFFQIVERIIAEPPDLTCSFSNIQLSNHPIGDFFSLPHLSILVDPAIYSLHQLKGDYTYISCIDLGDLDFLQKLNFKRAFPLLHAADRAHLTTPSKERPYDVVFFGSCTEHKSEDERVLIAAKRVLSDKNVSILEALVALDIPDKQLPRYHMEVDLLTRFQDRIELLQSLKNHRLHIWGTGPWKRYVPCATVHPPIPFEQTLEVMKQAKVVVNSSPRFKRGLHERIVYGSMCGAALLSDSDFGYRRVEEYDFSNWEEIALMGQAKTLEAHTWDHRAHVLLNGPTSFHCSI